MIKSASLLCLSILAYTILIIPFASFMREKPAVEKLGYVPRVEVVQGVSADQKELIGALLVAKVIMYFGGLMDKRSNTIPLPPDYPAMSRIIHGAVRLDPYNMDAYYFAQAILVWDVGKVQIANELLDYGMRYRYWDWYLPFFAGFNHAYFLKDYTSAARYYKRAGELSGSDLFKNLAGRYMQESGETGIAIAYLSAMEKEERNPAIKKSYQTRIAAFREVRRIELARDRFRLKYGNAPVSIEALLQKGYLSVHPVDPYGGRFYIEPDGRVTTTSKFAFSSHKREGETR
jgi:hypothetical protein